MSAQEKEPVGQAQPTFFVDASYKHGPMLHFGDTRGFVLTKDMRAFATSLVGWLNRTIAQPSDGPGDGAVPVAWRAWSESGQAWRLYHEDLGVDADLTRWEPIYAIAPDQPAPVRDADLGRVLRIAVGSCETWDAAARLFLEQARLVAQPAPARTFQARNAAWMEQVFAGDPTDLSERVNRYGEESLELQQSLGQTASEAHALVDYVHGRAIGEPGQEYGGTMTTLALLATVTGHDLMACGEAELARCSTPEIVAKIREKRSKRHGRGPLPGTYAPDFTPAPAGTGADAAEGLRKSASRPCQCWACIGERGERPQRFVVCQRCGNKRCPHCDDHRLVCSGSNDVGQIGVPATLDRASPQGEG